MNDDERIDCIVNLLKNEREKSFYIGNNYDIVEFLELLEKSNGRLDDILVNGSKEIFFETVNLAKKYHCAEGEYKNRKPQIGLNLDMLYRLCDDAKNGFSIIGEHDVLNFSKIFRNRVLEYIGGALK